MRNRLSIQKPSNRITSVRRPYSLFSQIMDDFFDEMVFPEVPQEGIMAAPKIDLIDKENHFVLQAEIPGIDKKDIEIELLEDSITIKGEKRLNNEQKEGKYYYRESSYGKFMRQIPFPEKVNTEQAKACYENGLLKIELPKSEISKARKLELK